MHPPSNPKPQFLTFDDLVHLTGRSEDDVRLALLQLSIQPARIVGGRAEYSRQSFEMVASLQNIGEIRGVATINVKGVN